MMKLRFITFLSRSLVIFLFFLSSVIIAQDEFLYENITVADGLSSSSFNPFETIYQDKFGFLWFGTTDGLNRYDGYEFKVYKNIPGDSTSLPSSNIYLVTEDEEGNLWIGTAGMMSLFDRTKNQFYHYPIDQGNNSVSQPANISHSLIDSKNNFWITTQGRAVQRWNKEEKQWNAVPFNLPIDGEDTLAISYSVPAFAITELRNGNILVTSFVNGVFYYNESSNSFDPFNFAGNELPPGIVEVFEDRGGNIWLAGRDTFIKYNPKSFTFEYMNDWKRLKTFSGDSFYFNIDEREDGTFLLCSIPAGLMKFDPSTEKFELLKVGGELEQRGVGRFAFTKIKDKFGVYWVGLGDNGILKFDPKRKPFRYTTFEQDNSSQTNRPIITDIKANTEDPNELIIATNRNGFYTMKLDDKSLKKINIPIKEIYSDSGNVFKFVLDDNQKIWFSSTTLKLSSYDLKSGQVESFQILERKSTTGGGESILDLEYIPKNKVVISTNIGGYIFNTVSKSIEPIPSTMNRKYSDEFISFVKKKVDKKKPLEALIKVGEAANLSKSFVLKEKKSFLVVCLGEGNHPVGVFDFGFIESEDGTTIWSMDKINKTFYGGGGYKNRLLISVVTLDPGKYSINYVTDVGHSYNNFNVHPPNNPDWYGIQLIELNEDESKELNLKVELEEKQNNVPDYYIARTMLGSRKYPSDLWIGADEKGIIKFDLTNNKFEQYAVKENLTGQFFTNSIFEDSKGRLWITIIPSGFYRFLPETNEFISNASIPDLTITGINGIIEDFQGSIWVSSSAGITKLTEHEDGSWSTSNYDSKDGVPGGFGSGSLITRSGEIYFGAFNGVTSFYPSTENTSPPLPIISNIVVSDVSLLNKDSKVKLTKSIFDLDELKLSFSQNDVSFEFASLHYSRPSKNRVSYNLEGFSDQWIFTDKNFASFTNLEPGDYTLHIKAYSGFGIPSEIIKSLKITVSPPWYRTTLAYISYGFIFIGLIFGIDRFQRKRLLTKEREKQKIQEAELRALAAEAQARAIQAENERKTKELEEARQLQLSMLPKKLPNLPNLDIAVYMQTATEVGGDYYDFHVSLDGTLTVVIGDATGHGMRAGTMVTAAKSLFSTHAANPDILFTFSEISRCLKQMDMHLLTMCMTVLKIKENRMIMSSAGMPPALIYRNSNKKLEEITIKGMPLGAVDKFPYYIKETEVSAGDTLFLMSDGLPELFNNQKELFGYDRVQNEFHKTGNLSPEEIINRLKSRASDWTGGKDPNDDVTFVVIKIK